VLSASRQLAVCRELTKIHEEVVRGTATEVQEHFIEHSSSVRGECVVIIGPEKG
jgi:16S rRNA (cytidine1402-2'-O)-methyltransferase